MTVYDPPIAQWFKDGVPVTTMPINMAVGSNGRLSSTLSFNFQESDAGVYQCIFTGSNLQIFGAIPLRLDTGLICKQWYIFIVLIFTHKKSYSCSNPSYHTLAAQ